MRISAFLGVLLTSGMAATAAGAQDDANRRDRNTLIVRGEGEVKAKPDVAYATLGVITEGKRAQEAAAANAALTQKVMDAVRRQGVAEKDMQTSNFSVQPRYENRPNREPVIVGYQVSNQVRVTVRDLNKVGQVIDTGLDAGANNIYGLNFALEERARYTTDALTGAVREARRKAETLAAAAGVRLQGIVQLVEDGAARVPILQDRMEMSMARAATPVAPGEITVTASVTVVYAIAQNAGR
jgi:hypothetical protein